MDLSIVKIVGERPGIAPGDLEPAVGDRLDIVGLTAEQARVARYRWLRGTTAIQGATRAWYAVQAADQGENLIAQATLPDATVLSSAAVAVPAAPAPGGDLGEVGVDGFIYTALEDLTGEFDPIGDPQGFTVTYPGFTAAGGATTLNEPILFKKRKVQAFPNGANLTAREVVLDRFVYAGGTIASGTNSSTLPYPKPQAQWVSRDRQVLYTGSTSLTLRLGVNSIDGRNGKPVPAVRFVVTSSGGGTPVTATVSSCSDYTCPLTGRHLSVYEATVDTATLGDGRITADAILFPWIGDAAWQISVDYYDRETDWNGLSVQYHIKAAADPRRYAAVNTATGDDGTGVVDADRATAKAAPFATAKAAATALSASMVAGNVGVVLLAASQTHTVGRTNTVTIGDHPLTFEGEGSGATRAIFIEDTVDNGNPQCPIRASVYNCRIQKGASTSSRGWATRAGGTGGLYNEKQFFGCAFEIAGGTDSALAWQNYWADCGRVSMWDCSCDVDTGMIDLNASSIAAFWLIGCSGMGGKRVHGALGCDMDVAVIPQDAGAGSAVPQVGMMIENCRFPMTNGSNCINLDGYDMGREGLSIVGNVLTIGGGTTGAADDTIENATQGPPTNVFNYTFAQNTMAGGDSNGPNDNKTVVAYTGVRCHIRYVGNVLRSRVLPDGYDDAGTGDGTADRRLNEPQRYGVSMASNLHYAQALSDAAYAYNGKLGIVGGIADRVIPAGDTRPGFADDQSFDGGNTTGAGDYTITTNTGLVPLVRGQDVLRAFDIAGVAIPTDGTARAGAYQVAP